MGESKKCPHCGETCDRDSVHNGVAMLHGPWGCPSCKWSEYEEYDLRDGPKTKDGCIVDQYGGLTPLGSLSRSVGARHDEEDDRELARQVAEGELE